MRESKPPDRILSGASCWTEREIGSPPVRAVDRDRQAISRYRLEAVAAGVFSLLTMLAASLVLDARVRPRRGFGWRWQGLAIHLLCMTGLFGAFLAGSGNAWVAAAFTVSLMALFTISSNAKHKMLGEPMLFSDLALFAALFRHPRFYFTAVSMRLRWALGLAAPVLLLALAWLFVPRPAPHLAGLGLTIGASGVLLLFLGSRASSGLARTPDVDADADRYGLVATTLLYWLRWRAMPDPPTCPPVAADGSSRAKADKASPEIIVIVQCESFSDPVELTGQPADAMPGLARARSSACQWGELAVSGFGAYTMRTEYGILFGRGEEALGFRRYDPFLTAQGELSYALPARLRAQEYQSAFVHPHEMRFYRRDRLMPAMGFTRLVGEEHFPAIQPENGRYIDDRALGALLGRLIDEAAGPTLLYAVTMENHGPWMKDRLTGSPGGLEAYLRHLRSSDMMLTDLADHLATCGRSALLVFFGDHRPSIPGVTQPGGDRHTPYVMLRYAADGTLVTGDNRRVDLSPDELHHAILHQTHGPADLGGPAPKREDAFSATAA